ncbi:MAG: hypothetical protein WA957_05040, partial [Alteraurantiacibacter sp.]
FSGEVISTFERDALIRMRTYMSAHFSEIKIIGYVRPPIPFLDSATQQKIKGRKQKRLDDSIRLPDYGSFINFDEVFGRENVDFSLFDRSVLVSGDVVLDFAKKSGLCLRTDQVIRMNDGVSLEALSFIYTKRNHGEPVNWREPKMGAADMMFISKLSVLGERKFTLAENLVAPLLDRRKKGIDWAEERIGASLRPPLVPSAHAIASDADLESVAVESAHLLDMIMPGLAPSEPTVESVALKLDDLHHMCQAETGA